MSRYLKIALILTLVVLTLVAIACGGGSNEKAPAETTAPATTHATPGSSDSASSSVDGAGALGGIFETVFNSGVLEGAQPSGASSGDSTLEQYLLTAGDLPSGYTSQGTFSESIPAGTSFGGGDVAISIATKGDMESSDFTEGAVLGSMVVRLNNPDELEKAMTEAKALNDQSLEEAIGAGSSIPFITDVHVLDTSSLGDNSVGIAMTMDLSELISAFAGAFGATDAANAPTPPSMVMSMHIILSGHGDLAGGIVSVSFGSTTSDVDEMELAGIVDQKLRDAAGE